MYVYCIFIDRVIYRTFDILTNKDLDLIVHIIKTQIYACTYKFNMF